MIVNPTRQDLVELIGNESGTCVSILMRTHESGRETTQNPIRFKNLITKAIDEVAQGDGKLHRQLSELAKLEHDQDFWQHQSAGFAVYVCEGFEQRFTLSHAPDEAIEVGDHFYTLPIAGVSCGGGSVRVLALSWERARLFSCDGHQAQEISDDQFPVSMEDLVTQRDPEEQLQFSTHSTQGAGPSGPGSGSTAMFHGHGEGEDKIKADRDMYLTRVGRMVADVIYNTDHPLVVLATEEVSGHFTSTTNVKVAEVIHGSPDGLKDQDLHERIVKTSHALLEKSGKDVVEKLGTAIANNAGSKDLKEIILQAADGRIDTLLLGKTEPQYGTLDRSARTVEVDNGAGTDLVNLAVHETLQAGGTVVNLTDETFDVHVAAIYRY